MNQLQKGIVEEVLWMGAGYSHADTPSVLARTARFI